MTAEEILFSYTQGYMNAEQRKAYMPVILKAMEEYAAQRERMAFEAGYNARGIKSIIDQQDIDKDYEQYKQENTL